MAEPYAPPSPQTCAPFTQQGVHSIVNQRVVHTRARARAPPYTRTAALHSRTVTPYCLIAYAPMRTSVGPAGVSWSGSENGST
jgi:hypothetical protein